MRLLRRMNKGESNQGEERISASLTAAGGAGTKGRQVLGVEVGGGGEDRKRNMAAREAVSKSETCTHTCPTESSAPTEEENTGALLGLSVVGAIEHHEDDPFPADPFMNSTHNNSSRNNSDSFCMDASINSSVVSRKEDESRQFKLLKSLKSERRILEPKFISTKAKATAIGSDMSLQRLKWSKLSLYGREKEIHLISQAFQRVATGASSSQSTTTSTTTTTYHGGRALCLIQGQSGAGKTALAMQLRKEAQRVGGLFVLGKFNLQEQGSVGEPFSAITEAVNGLCEKIVNKQQQQQQQGINRIVLAICNKLSQELTRETIILVTKMVPSLLQVMTLGQQQQQKGTNPNSKENTTPLDLEAEEEGKHGGGDAGAAGGGKEALERLNFAFKILIRVISEFVPLCIVIDDIQWADKPSINLIRNWITDVQTTSLMIVGCYRSNEVDDKHTVSEMIHDVELLSRERGIEVLKLSLGDIDQQAVTALLADVLNMEADRIRTLADIVYSKTGGNCFYLIQFVESLILDSLLVYNFGLGYWTWIDQEVLTKSKMTENVIALMKTKLEKSKVAAQILPVAALLGARFSFDSVCVILTSQITSANSTNANQNAVAESGRSTMSTALNEPSASFSTIGEHEISFAFSMAEEGGVISGAATVRKMLEECQEAGFIYACPEEVFAFAHDKVQEASLALLEEKDLPDLQFQVGDILLTRLGEEGLGNLIFPVANLLKAKQSNQSQAKQIEIARLCVRAGNLSIYYSAFAAATRYYRNAMELLPQNHWETYFDLSLMCFVLAAEAEYCIGNYNGMRTYCEEALKQTAVPASVRTRLHNNLMDAALAENKHSEANETGHLAMQEIRVKVPKSTPAVLYCVVSGIAKARHNPKNTIQRLQEVPVSQDPLHVAAMRITEKLGTVGFLSGQPPVFVACALFNFRRSLDKGITPYTAISLAQIGAVITGMVGDPVSGKFYAEEALALLERVDSRAVEAKTRFFVGMFVMHWTKPYGSAIGPLMVGYRCGMKNGDPEYAFYCAYYVMLLSYFTGRQLGDMEKEMDIYLRQMQDYQQEVSVWFLLPVIQSVLNLRHESSQSTTELTGEAMKEVDLMKFLGTADATVYCGICMKMILATHFGEWEAGANIALEHGAAGTKAMIGLPHSEAWQFSCGLCLYAFAQQTNNKNKKYFYAARNCRRQLKKWLQNGNPNCTAYCALLDAEKAALLDKKHSVVSDLYQKAIILAARMGNPQDQALASERLAGFQLRQGDHAGAKYCFEAARDLYAEWGALAKVQRLEERLCSLQNR